MRWEAEEVVIVVDQKDALEGLQGGSQLRDVPLIEASGRHQDPGIALQEELLQGFRAECGKQGAENAEILEGSQSRDVKFRHADGKNENCIALSDFQFRNSG
jgi:hypothetical protein